MTAGGIISGVGKVLLTMRERLRSPLKSTVSIAVNSLIAATEPHCNYLKQKTSEPMDSAGSFWNKKRLRDSLIKVYVEDKGFVFHRSDSRQLAGKLLHCFILPNHLLEESELVSLIQSIINSAKEIFMESLPNDKKAIDYHQLRDSRLLDTISRKQGHETTELAAVVATLKKVAGEKQSTLGYRDVSREKLIRLSRVYVPPNEYGQFYSLLDKLHLLAIVGQPHVGKTTTAYMLARQLSLNKGNLQIVEAIDHDSARSDGLLSVTGSIVIFDDIFGEAQYEYFGPNLKFIRTLLDQNNYIILTSREYIFEEAKIKTKILDELPQLAPEMIQEGSYRTSDLEKILVNHIKLAIESGELGRKTENSIYLNISYILNELRFPHNIEMFVNNCKIDSDGQVDIRGAIEMSKKIGELVQRIIVQGSEEEQHILLLCALMKEIKLSRLEDLLTVIGHKKERFNLTIKNYRYLMIADPDQDVLRYKHPSFRESVIDYFEENDMTVITSLTFLLLEAAESKFINLKPLHNIIFRMTREMDASTLAQLFRDKDIDIRVNTILFSNLIYKDPALAVETFLQLNRKGKMKSLNNLTTHNSIEKAMNYIIVGLKSGKILFSKRLAWLIPLLIIGYKVLDLYHALDDKNRSELSFKVSLLTPLCHKFPSIALREILYFLRTDMQGNIRRSLYGVLSEFRGAYIPIVLDLVKVLLSFETNPSGKNKLERVVHNLHRAAQKEGEDHHILEDFDDFMWMIDHIKLTLDAAVREARFLDPGITPLIP